VKTVAIIQARLASTRLFAKTLLPLPSGRSVLEEVVWRCREAKTVSQVVVAIPDTRECDILLNFTGGATVVRGPEHDVLERYRRAAEITGADVIVRVTSDCPVIPPAMIDAVVSQRTVHGLSYACNCLPPTWPLGYTCEAFTRSALMWHAANSHDRESREHVTAAMRRVVGNNRQYLDERMGNSPLKGVNLLCPYGDYSNIRWTLDTPADYVDIWRAMAAARDSIDLLEVVRAGQ
jgi:spore coat polysaccharide biosynthesis protein SpsF